MGLTELYESIIKPYVQDRGVTWEIQGAEEDVSSERFYIVSKENYSPSFGGSVGSYLLMPLEMRKERSSG